MQLFETEDKLNSWCKNNMKLGSIVRGDTGWWHITGSLECSKLEQLELSSFLLECSLYETLGLLRITQSPSVQSSRLDRFFYR